jgi:hypothetical protein
MNCWSPRIRGLHSPSLRIKLSQVVSALFLRGLAGSNPGGSSLYRIVTDSPTGMNFSGNSWTEVEMRLKRHIYPEELMNPDLLSRIVLIGGILVGVVYLFLSVLRALH